VSGRDHLLRDSTIHLTDELAEVLVRHMRLVRAAGYSMAEESAIAMTAAEALLAKAAGTMLIGIEPSMQSYALDDLALRVLGRLHRKKPEIIAGLARANREAGR